MSHPRTFEVCECGHSTWDQSDRPAGVGPTYVCTGCERERYVYDRGAGQSPRHEFRDVTTGYLRVEYFRSIVGRGPYEHFEHEADEPLSEFRGAAAIDFWMTEREGLTQSGWADEIGISQAAVSKNSRAVKEAL